MPGMNHQKIRELREKAEAVVGPMREMGARLPHYELSRLFHELDVYEAELHTQYEEMEATQQRLDHLCEKYRDLYENAPAGYFTLNAKARIEEVNEAGARLMGIRREALRGSFLSAYLSQGDADRLHLHLGQVRESPEPRAVHLKLRTAEGETIEARMDSSYAPAAEGSSASFRCVVTRRESP